MKQMNSNMIKRLVMNNKEFYNKYLSENNSDE